MVTLTEKPFRPRALRTRRRLWAVPWGLPKDPAEADVMEGSGILDEFSGSEGLVLWQSFQDVLLWAGADQPGNQFFASGSLARRRALIRTSGIAGEPCEWVSELALLLLGSRPAVPDVSERVASRCGRLAEWAASLHAWATATAFARAAAAVGPTEAAAAFRVGRLAVDAGQRTMARTWFARAIALARRQGDWATYGSANFEMGSAAHRRGEAREALRFYRRANWAARRGGHRALRGPALHGRARAELDLGAFEDAERHLRLALLAFRSNDAAIGAVQHDLADLLLRRGGDCSLAAVGLLKELWPKRGTPVERVETLTLLVRAAAAAEDAATLEGAWFEAVEILSGMGETVDAGRMLLELAKATSTALDRRSHAEEVARRALRIGEAVNDSFLRRQAAAFLMDRPRRRIA